jgi:hypothetical protein
MVRRAQPGEVNWSTFDGWAVGHGIVGALFALGGAPLAVTLGASVAWEAAEPGLKRRAPGIFPASTLDTPRNKAGDVAAFGAGWFVGEALQRRID